MIKIKKEEQMTDEKPVEYLVDDVLKKDDLDKDKANEILDKIFKKGGLQNE